MKKFMTGFIAIVILILAGWGICHFGMSSYEGHISNAQAALTELEVFTQTGIITEAEPIVQLIQTVRAEEENAGELQVENLVEEIVLETERALWKIQKNNDTEELNIVLKTVDQLQDKTIAVFSDVLEIVENEAVLNIVAEAMEITEADNEQVEIAVNAVMTAIEAGEEEIIIEIETQYVPRGLLELFAGLISPIDEGKLTDTDSTPTPNDDGDDKLTGGEDDGGDDDGGKLTDGDEDDSEEGDSQTTSICGMAQVSLSMNQGAMDSDLEKKMQQIQAEFAFCNQDGTGEECQMTKIKGLCIALQSKIQNSVRQQEKQEVQDTTVKGRQK